MRLSAAIFDLDGVIVFTDQLHYRAWKEMADSLNIYFDEQINDRLRGVSRMESLDIILEKYNGKPLSPKEKEALADHKNSIYKELLKTMTPKDVTDEVRETLKELKARGYKLAIGSSSKNARFILEQVELINVFDEVSDGTQIKKSKPDPEVFLNASTLLNEEPHKCLVIEDADAGIVAGKAAGMKTAAIGPATANQVSDYNLTTFSDLLNILK